MPESPHAKEALEAALNDLVEADLAVLEDWITDEALDANPSLVKTMSVSPPRGQGRVRLIRIGSGDTQVDLQPCGGTHVAANGRDRARAARQDREEGRAEPPGEPALRRLTRWPKAR